MKKNDRPAFGFEVLQQDGAARRAARPQALVS